MKCNLKRKTEKLIENEAEFQQKTELFADWLEELTENLLVRKNLF